MHPALTGLHCINKGIGNESGQQQSQIEHFRFVQAFIDSENYIWRRTNIARGMGLQTI